MSTETKTPGEIAEFLSKKSVDSFLSPAYDQGVSDTIEVVKEFLKTHSPYNDPFMFRIHLLETMEKLKSK